MSDKLRWPSMVELDATLRHAASPEGQQEYWAMCQEQGLSKEEVLRRQAEFRKTQRQALEAIINSSTVPFTENPEAQAAAEALNLMNRAERGVSMDMTYQVEQDTDTVDPRILPTLSSSRPRQIIAACDYVLPAAELAIGTSDNNGRGKSGLDPVYGDLLRSLRETAVAVLAEEGSPDGPGQRSRNDYLRNRLATQLAACGGPFTMLWGAVPAILFQANSSKRN